MRKRILSVLLCLVMLTSLFPATALAAGEEAEGPAAQVGGQTYSSLKAAITAAGEGGTITLLRDYRQQGDEDAVLLDLTDKTLDLNGFTYHFGYACHFTGSNGTIKNGAMTIDDNSNDTWALAVNGPYADHFTIDGVTLNKGVLIQHGTDVQLNDLTVTTPERNDAAAVQINGGCSATITGGSYTATGYAASAVHNNGGTLTINGGKFFASGSDARTLWNGLEQNTDNRVTISTTTINDGIFTKENGWLLYNWSKLTVNGGTFTAENGFLNDYLSTAETTVNDGHFGG